MAVVEFALPDSVSTILKPDEDILPTDWTERHRILTDRDAGEPGPFRYDGTPYWIEPTNALVDPRVGTVTVIKASRCGGSELLKNVLAYSIDQRPMPTSYVLPRDTDVTDEFRGALVRMIENSPRLAAHKLPGTWATETSLALDTMLVSAAKASTPMDFIRRTFGLNLFDEVDNCEEQAKSSRLGSIWTLLLERLTTYRHRGKQFGVSTPTTADAAAWQAYEVSDRRRYWTPCPYCGVYQVIHFETLWLMPGFEEIRDPDLITARNLVRHRCENPDCGGMVPDGEKLWMTQRGIWVPACQKIVGTLDVDSAELVARSHFRTPVADRWTPPLKGDAPITRNRGYWLDATVSPWRTFSEILAKFFATKDKPRDYRVFVNSWRALAWREAAQTANVSDLKKRLAGAHAPDVIPARAVKLICYADVQDNRLEYGVAALGPGEEIWLIKQGVAESFEEVEQVAFNTAFPYEDDPDQHLTCELLGYDSGGHRTFESYERWAKRPHEIVLTKGSSKGDMAEKWTLSHVERYLNGQKKPTGIRLFIVNTGIYKEKAYNLYQREGHGPGTFHFHRETTQGFLDQATSEEYVPLKRKKQSKAKYAWQLKTEGRRNEGLDIIVGLLFMADRLNAKLLPTREVLRARASNPLPATTSGTGGGIRMPDGRPFLATRRR